MRDSLDTQGYGLSATNDEQSCTLTSLVATVNHRSAVRGALRVATAPLLLREVGETHCVLLSVVPAVAEMLLATVGGWLARCRIRTATRLSRGECGGCRGAGFRRIGGRW